MMCFPSGKANGAGWSALSSLTETDGRVEPGVIVSTWPGAVLAIELATEDTARIASEITDMVD